MRTHARAYVCVCVCVCVVVVVVVLTVERRCAAHTMHRPASSVAAATAPQKAAAPAHMTPAVGVCGETTRACA